MSVGVVIPTRNMASTIGDALESACSQNPDIVVVIDDASEDETSAVVGKFANVRYERWPIKSECHVTASRPVYESLDCEHLIGLAADDILLPGLVDAVRSHLSRAVVFTNYTCEMAGNPSKRWEAKHPYAETTILDPEQVKERLRTQPAVETGIGSSVRRDVMGWLWRMGWSELGPHADSIGYASAAATFGCVYIPIYGAHTIFNPNSYGQRNAGANREQHAEIASAFMGRCGLDDLTVAALVDKRCHFKPHEQVWFHNE